MSLKTMGTFGKGGLGGGGGGAGLGAVKSVRHADDEQMAALEEDLTTRPALRPLAGSVNVEQGVRPDTGASSIPPGTSSSSHRGEGEGEGEGGGGGGRGYQGGDHEYGDEAPSEQRPSTKGSIFSSASAIRRRVSRRRSSLALTPDTDVGGGSVMDVHGTADRAAGPYPHPYEPRLVAWIKLEELEYMCKPHDTAIERISDSAKREQMTVNLAYAKGSTSIQVDQVGRFGPEIRGRATESKPLYIFNENRRDYIACVGVESGTEIKVLPTSHDGGRFDVLDFVSGHVSQGVSENMPVYRRNVVNYLPSIRFTPEQFVAVEEESLLQSRLSGPTHQGGFTWFAVSKGYANDGSSPWPLFTALDTMSGFAFQVQVVVEQKGDDGFEPRWKVACGKASDKTSGVDPKQFHIIVVQKIDRVVRLFVDGCQTGSPAAELLIEEENVADINYTMFGLDANGSKFFDGELAEFLAYSEPIPNMSVDQVGKYLSRKYDLPWKWQRPKRSDLLDNYLAQQEAKAVLQARRASINRSVKSAESDETEATSEGGAMGVEGARKIDDLLLQLPSPEAAQVAMDTLSNMAKDHRALRNILSKLDWDVVFEYMESTQAPTRTASMRFAGALAEGSVEAKKIIVQKEGLFLMLKACQPTWKIHIETLVAKKRENHAAAVEHRESVQEKLSKVPAYDLNQAFKLRTEVQQAGLKVQQCLIELDAAIKRMQSGVEERNSWNLQMETLKTIATMIDDDEHATAMFLEFGGVSVLHMVISSPSIPVQTSACKVVGVLVKATSTAKKLLSDHLLGKVVRLAFVDDPPLQCDAVGVIATVLTHPELSMPMIELNVSKLRRQEEKELAAKMKREEEKPSGLAHKRITKAVPPGDTLLEALQFMLSSSYDDSHLLASRCLYLIATHDPQARAKISVSGVIVPRAVQLCLSSNVKMRRALIQVVALIVLDKEAATMAWDAGLDHVLYELLQDGDFTVVTNSLMALGNVSRWEEHALKMLDMDEELGLIEFLCELGLARDEPGIQHLICGVLSNACTPPGVQSRLIEHYPILLEFLVAMCERGTLHARYIAAGCLRKLSNTVQNVDRINEAGAIAPLVAMARTPKVVVNEPHMRSAHRNGKSLYLHWQAGRSIAALTKSEAVHMDIYKKGGIFALVQICQSGMGSLCREGAAAIAFMAEVKCEPEVLLQMAEDGAIDAMSHLAEDADDSTGSEAIRALSSLLNFDNAWAD